ncbi:MAG TPA: glycosyltransferase, partial [Phnomibacter sp.]|nr:glycosyltransferase [Phnomibacter sp.]
MGYATDGGFVFHMQAIASLCEQVTLVVPVVKPKPSGEVLFTAANIKVVPLALPEVVGVRRKLAMGWFIIKQLVPFISIIKKHDAVHTPIPSDVGTVGMLIAHIMNKPLLVRHCGNWYKQTTLAEKFWKWYMEKYAGGKRVFLATGGGLQPPSAKNPNIQWIFSSSLSKAQLALNSQRNAINAAPVWHLAIACRQDEKKGTGRAIQALALLPNAAQFRLHIVGDGPDLPAFKQLAQDLGVTDLVSFYGKLSHQKVLEVLKRADLFVYPTDASEGFPKVVLEAMSCGLPVIT